MTKPTSPHAVALELNEVEASVAAFRHPGDVLDEQAAAELITQLADALTPVLQFIAKGRLGGTMQHRAWVWLHETRLDLIGAESIEDYAKRAGVSAPRIYEFVQEFRAMIPAYRSPNVKSAATRARMSQSQRRRVAAATDAVANTGAANTTATANGVPRATVRPR